MDDGDERPLVRFRMPVSEDYWREYGVPLALLLGTLGAAAVVAARELDDGLVVGATVVGLSVGAVLAGLLVYNVVVIALLVAQR
ncbi:hypothetical protein [Halorussus litoreus]|uniref:hypothetical protein n=1 Tax=Halorussus litoreus TaxID=1710536 RepID=UPI000E22AB7C|nr:hypothetical protein [Halorussus litoreus]